MPTTTPAPQITAVPVTAAALVQALVPVLNLAGEWMRVAQHGVQTQTKASASGVGGSSIHNALTDVDLLVQETLERELSRCFSDLAMFGEEATAHNVAPPPNATHAISIDPLDGTHAYCLGLEDFCTMISLFDGTRIAAGILHFPTDRETLVAIAGDGIYRVRYDADTGVADPFRSAGWQLEALPPVAPAAPPIMAVHYRFLKPPYRPLAERCIAAGYRMETLAGDDAVAWAAPALLGSNGSLVRSQLRHGGAAYVAPYIAFHDLAPLVPFFADRGAVQFYDPDTAADAPWQPIPAARVVAEAMHCRPLRCRVILAADASQLAAIERSINTPS